jgi:CO dehydrogenase/acetyl-CoA synthase beta subunit
VLRRQKHSTIEVVGPEEEEEEEEGEEEEEEEPRYMWGTETVSTCPYRNCQYVSLHMGQRGYLPY